MSTEQIIEQGEDPGLDPAIIVGRRDNGDAAVVGAPTAPASPGLVARAVRTVAALGLLAPACSQPTPTAHRGAPRDESAVSAPSAEAAVSAGGEGGPPSSTPPASIEPAAAPTTTVTVTVPTTVARSTTTTVAPFVLPERQNEAMDDIEWLIRSTFPETPDKAVRVARCESGLDPEAVSPDGANWGLMQVNVVHKGLAARLGYSWGQMLQAGPNLAVARAVYDRAGGWGPWSCA